MVLKHDSIIERLGELDLVVHELNLHAGVTEEKMRTDLSQRWIIERGMIAAASLILDIADHILVEQFGLHTTTYEDSLIGLRDKAVITDNLYQQLKGLGGFRNILVHLYQEVDIHQLWQHSQKAETAFPQFSIQIITWLDQQTIVQ